MSFSHVARVGCLALLTGAICWAESRAPVAVSPGGANTGAAVESRCPTFSWGAVLGAKSYELVVYRVGEDHDEEEPVVRQTVAGSALSWTPPLDSCLERGSKYAWSVRAEGEEATSEWSTPSLFEVAVGWSEAEFEKAIEVIRTYLHTDAEMDDRRIEPVVALKNPGANRSATPVIGAPVGTAAVTVEGEVRTVDTVGLPRLWGRGRGTKVYGRYNDEGLLEPCESGATLFGLSWNRVSWGSAADACPAGTWVCSSYEMPDASCDTTRPDTAEDWYECSGAPVDEDTSNHPGWLSDADASPSGCDGFVFTEANTVYCTRGCNSLPVWCCWE